MGEQEFCCLSRFLLVHVYMPCIGVKDFLGDRVEFFCLFAFDKDFRIIDVVLENAFKSVLQVHFD